MKDLDFRASEALMQGLELMPRRRMVNPQLENAGRLRRPSGRRHFRTVICGLEQHCVLLIEGGIIAGFPLLEGLHQFRVAIDTRVHTPQIIE